MKNKDEIKTPWKISPSERSSSLRIMRFGGRSDPDFSAGNITRDKYGKVSSEGRILHLPRRNRKQKRDRAIALKSLSESLSKCD
jgi:hypothetical protein